MSSGFVTETELAEARQKRQEEWEKVRILQPDLPQERPEEPYDGRSLFDRLKEQKMRKDLEYDEAHKLKNLIRGLDDDEVHFLELVDQSKLNAEKQQQREEEKELKEFRNRVATLQEESADKKIQAEIRQHKAAGQPLVCGGAARPSQKSLLGIGIKRKSAGTPAKIAANVVEPNEAIKTTTAAADAADEPPQKLLASITTDQFDKGSLKCIAILPGIGPYTASSDSEMSSGSDDEPEPLGKYDLCGRMRIKKKCQDDC